MSELSKIYDKAFFEWHRPLRADYLKIGTMLMLSKDYSSVLDIGCGNGYFLEAFGSQVLVRGIEGSHHCLNEIRAQGVWPGKVSILDVTIPFVLFEKFSLVICTEVGEHLEERHADTLVNNISNHAFMDVFFSAATPGQGGHHHLNEQPHSYWIEKFTERGYVVNDEMTSKIRECAKGTALSWIRDNAIMFTVAE